jgi:hypothetical protein
MKPEMTPVFQLGILKMAPDHLYKYNSCATVAARQAAAAAALALAAHQLLLLLLLLAAGLPTRPPLHPWA